MHSAPTPRIGPGAAIVARLRRFHRNNMMDIALATIFVALVLVFFAPHMLIDVPAGHVGVQFRRFGGGTDVDHPLAEGLHFVLPWNKVTKYDTRFRQVTENFDAITKDGLAISATVAFRFRLVPQHVGLLHKHVGPDYLNVILVPEIGAHTRTLISKYTAEEFYTTERESVQQQTLDLIRRQLYVANIYSAEGIVLLQVEDVLIKAITLPPRVAEAIERKLEQYQQQLEYDFRIVSEQKEAERKRIEGDGVRALFDRVGRTQLGEYLRLQGIQATVKLAASDNAKMVVLGNGSAGMPLILGNLDGELPAPAVQKPAPTPPRKAP